MSKIFDCVMLFNELDMLDLRFNILGDAVDYFVVVESSMTHSGNRKRYVFEPGRFGKWAAKIIYCQVGTLPGENSWIRERNHRSMITPALAAHAQPDDWIVVCDVDEIPTPEVYRQLRQDINLHFMRAKIELDFYYYNFNCRVQQGWAVGAARYRLGYDANAIRTCSNGIDAHFDEGWGGYEHIHKGFHASYFMTPAQIIEKNRSFMHHADPVISDLPADENYIQRCIDTPVDLYGRDLTIERVPLSDSLPKYVLDNQDKYKKLGWIVE